MSAWLERLIARLALGTNLVPPADDVRRAAVAAVLRDAPDGPSVLLMKRTTRASDPWSGHISLPGGRYEPTDADLLATAIRETHEELAIELAHARLLGNLSVLHPRNSGPKGIEVTPFVFVATTPVEPRPGDEAESTFWLPLALAASGALDGSYEYPGSAMSWPSWTFEGHIIWGMTMRILGELIELSRA